jgi:hypothetical protein
MDAELTRGIRQACSVAHQPTGQDKFAKVKTGGNRIVDRERGELLAPANEE